MTLKGSQYMEHQRHLARLLRRYRLDAGLKQAELADLLGVSQSTVSKVETAVERRLDLIEMRSYLAPLGRSLEELAADLDEMIRGDSDH